MNKVLEEGGGGGGGWRLAIFEKNVCRQGYSTNSTNKKCPFNFPIFAEVLDVNSIIKKHMLKN